MDVTKGIEKLSIFRAQMSNTLSPQTRLTSGGKDSTLFEAKYVLILKVSLHGVDSLWGDCTFIPADWGS